MSSYRVPNSSAQIMERTVSDPWPQSVAPVMRLTVPSSQILTMAAQDWWPN